MPTSRLASVPLVVIVVTTAFLSPSPPARAGQPPSPRDTRAEVAFTLGRHLAEVLDAGGCIFVGRAVACDTSSSTEAPGDEARPSVLLLPSTWLHLGSCSRFGA